MKGSGSGDSCLAMDTAVPELGLIKVVSSLGLAEAAVVVGVCALKICAPISCVVGLLGRWEPLAVGGMLAVLSGEEVEAFKGEGLCDEEPELDPADGCSCTCRLS